MTMTTVVSYDRPEVFCSILIGGLWASQWHANRCVTSIYDCRYKQARSISGIYTHVPSATVDRDRTAGACVVSCTFENVRSKYQLLCYSKTQVPHGQRLRLRHPTVASMMICNEDLRRSYDGRSSHTVQQRVDEHQQYRPYDRAHVKTWARSTTVGYGCARQFRPFQLSPRGCLTPRQ